MANGEGFTTDDAPNPWSAILEYSKSIVTLAAALLAVTVTFADKLLAGETSGDARWWLVTCWGLLVATVLTGVLAAAFSINFLRKQTKQSACILSVNLSFFFLAGAVGVLLYLGYLGSRTTAKPDFEKAIHSARAVAIASAGGTADEWQATNVTWALKDGFTVDVQRRNGSVKFRIAANHGGEVRSLKSIP